MASALQNTTYTYLDEIHDQAASIKRMRQANERLTDALRVISRKKIMDSMTAINMRSVALAALAVEGR